MRAGMLIIGAGVVLAGPSFAGPCTDQIAQLEKTLSSSDAGSGPTMKTGSVQNQGASGAASPGSPGAGPAVSATPSEAPRAGEVPKTGATVAMNTLTENRATSPQDVRAQTQGNLTASQVASGGSGPAQPDRLAKVNEALERAQSADRQGDAGGCANAIGEAKRLMGSP